MRNKVFGQRFPFETAGRSSVVKRRRFLAGVASGAVGIVSGCTDDVQPSTATYEYEKIDNWSVYAGPEVGISFPDEIQTVATPEDANLLFLSDTVDMKPDQPIEWVADGRVVAIIGDSPEEVWLSWRRSEAFSSTFGSQLISEGSSSPDMLLIYYNGSVVSKATYAKSGIDRNPDPTSSELLRAVDKLLKDEKPVAVES